MLDPGAARGGRAARGRGPRWPGGRAVAVFDRAGAIAGLAAADALARLASAGARRPQRRARWPAPEASRVGVLGAGPHAVAQLAALRTVRAVSGVRVFDPEPARLQAFAKAAGGGRPRPPRAPRRPSQDADLVVVATTARDPALRDDWVAPGAFVAAVGATRPGPAGARLPAARPGVRSCASTSRGAPASAPPTCSSPSPRGTWTGSRCTISGRCCAARSRAAARPDDIVLYKGTGSALAVVALAARGLVV